MSKNDYRKAEWIQKRELRFQLDQYRCLKCGRSRDSGVVLQVHHKKYLIYGKIWDSPLEDLETLCKGCHRTEHYPAEHPDKLITHEGQTIPAYGWELFDEIDLGDLSGTCDYCGTSIRYEHHIWHPEAEIELVVGVIHCDQFTGFAYASEKQHERRKYSERMSRFSHSARWTWVDGAYSRSYKRKYTIQIKPDGNNFRIYINGWRGNSLHEKKEQAITKAFNTLDDGSFDEFVSKYT